MQVFINIDGGSRGNPGPGAASYVICNAQHEIISQEGHFIPHCTNNQAEYTALKLALIKAKELGATELFIESDSLLLVKQFLGEYKIKNPDLATRMQIIRRLATPFRVHLKHVLREFNKAPDALGNQAMDQKESLGYNPIKHLPSDEELAIPSANKPHTINGVEVKPVVRKEMKTTKKGITHQPDLFGNF